MGSGAVIYLPSFIKIGSGIQKLIEETHRRTDTHRHQGHFICLYFLILKNRVGLRNHVAVCVCVCVRPSLSLLGNDSVKIPSLQGNGSVETLAR
jgi:hypothetical protein